MSDNVLTIGFSLGSIIDCKKAEEIFYEKGTYEFHKILEKHKNKNNIFAPGPALGLMMALRRLDRSMPDKVLKIKFALISKIDPNPQVHAVIWDSMRHYIEENRIVDCNNFGFDTMALTGGEPTASVCKAYGVDLIFTTSEDSAQDYFKHDIASVCIPNISAENNMELYNKRNGDICLISDFDGVIGDASGEIVFQEALKNQQPPVDAFLAFEEMNKDKPLELGVLGRTIQKLSKAVKYQKKIQIKSGSKEEEHITISVVTARSGQAYHRFMKTLEHHDIEISQFFMLQGANKNLILSELSNRYKGRNIMFFDDSKIHFTRSQKLKDLAPIWVPNEENTPKKEV